MRGLYFHLFARGRVWRCRNAVLSRPIGVQLLGVCFFLMMFLGLSGCGGTAASEGDDFKKENLSKIELGMTQKEVLELLGHPYIITTSLMSGITIYEYQAQTAKGFAGGFIYVAGVIDIKGSKVAIHFDSEGNVREIVYENTGEELYEEYRQ